MLAFVIPVKHPARSNSYERVCDLLRNTLRSIEGQTDPHFATVIVLNQKPSWAEDTPNRRFVEVDFPPAEAPKSENDWVNWLYMDRGAKIAVGILHAKQFSPTHLMPVDADDFVSNRLAGFVRAHNEAPGWYMPTGLAWSGVFRIFQPRERFWSYCGTSHVFRQDLLPIDDSIGVRPTRDAVVASLGAEYTEKILGNHVHYIRYFGERGITLEPLPFIGAILHADTGENSSRAWWRQSRYGPIWGRPLSAEQIEEFAVPPGERSPAQTALLYGWRARSVVVRTVRKVVPGLNGGGKK